MIPETLPQAHVEQYFGLWAIQEEPFRAAVAKVEGIDLTVHVAQQRARPDPSRGYQDYSIVRDNVALIELNGPLMKYSSSLSGGTSTVAVRRQIRNAVEDEQVASILMVVDSPGGTVAGTFDLVDEVAKAAKRKPLWAYIEDLGASAAYAVASQARAVYANRTAIVGSIGTFMVIEDQSARAEKLGIKVHVIRAGQFKGAGTPGTKISDEQLAEWQRLVNEYNQFFISALAEGRRMAVARAQGLADGRVHIGESARKLGLIDGVRTLDETLDQLTGPSSRSTQAVGVLSSTPAAASLPRPSSAPARSGNSRPSTSPARSDNSRPSNGSPAATTNKRDDTMNHEQVIRAWNLAVQAKINEGMSKRQAVIAVGRAQPNLHKQFLIATNSHKPSAVQHLMD